MNDEPIVRKNAYAGALGQWIELQELAPLATKCHVPPIQSKWLSRPRLIKRVNAGFKGKLILLSAPAGYGKNTLLADWIRQEQIAAAWFSIDKNDNDPLQFLAYLIAGVQGLKAGIGSRWRAKYK